MIATITDSLFTISYIQLIIAAAMFLFYFKAQLSSVWRRMSLRQKWQILVNDYHNPSLKVRGPLGIAIPLIKCGLASLACAGVLWIISFILGI